MSIHYRESFIYSRLHQVLLTEALFMFEQKRKEILKGPGKEIETTAIKEGNITIRSKKQLSQIIDTTLLKCYLQVGIVVQRQQNLYQKYSYIYLH
jgi:hypothetical protein